MRLYSPWLGINSRNACACFDLLDQFPFFASISEREKLDDIDYKDHRYGNDYQGDNEKDDDKNDACEVC